MSVERIVVNTGPLIAWALIDAIEIPGMLPYEFYCPAEVRYELEQGESRGYMRIAPEWLHVVSLKTPLSEMASCALDFGEAAKIQLALEHSIGWVCIDEWKGRRAAAAVGLKVVGSLGILAKAKQPGLISTLREMIERAVQEGIRYHPELVRNVLAAVGE